MFKVTMRRYTLENFIPIVIDEKVLLVNWHREQEVEEIIRATRKNLKFYSIHTIELVGFNAGELLS